ncbi:MAG TPA: HK97 gp10 family phage protein [Sphingomonas sp.]|jgi:hypothetical protein
MTFRMEGGRALDEALKQFAKPMAKTVARRALKKAADPILQAYRENTTKKTGALQKSEIAGTRLNPRQKRIAKKNPSKSALEVHIGTADPAGIQEEFGNINQAANPALRPAWDVHGGQVAVDRIGSVLEVEIKKQAERVARRAGRS